jgi:OCT family organic cation transporter-like MFS transporter 18
VQYLIHPRLESLRDSRSGSFLRLLTFNIRYSSSSCLLLFVVVIVQATKEWTMALAAGKPDTASAAADRALWVTYINVALYALCYQLQSPVEPFLIKSLSEKAGHADTVNQTYGNLRAFFSTIQTIGSPLVGILLDRVGIRKASAMVFLASALSYTILASASNLSLLFLSKVPTALQHAFLVAQATAATSCAGDSAARAAALGRMTTAYTIGATIGPALGGFLADHGDFYIGAKIAVFGSLLSVALSLAYLPNVTKPSEQHELKRKRSFVDELRHSGEIAMRSSLWPLLMVKVLGGVSSSMHSSALPLVLTQTLGFEPSQLGASMSFSMFAVAAFGAVAMAPLTQLLGSSGIVHYGLLARAALGGTVAMIVGSASGYTPSLLMQIVTVGVLHALASHLLATGLTTQTTGAVAKDEQGALLGLEHGLFSMARIGGPVLGTNLLSMGGSLWLVESACGAVDVLLVASLLVTMSTRSSSGKRE